MSAAAASGGSWSIRTTPRKRVCSSTRMAKAEKGVSAMPVSSPLRQGRPLTCAKAVTPATLAAARTIARQSPRAMPLTSCDQSSVAVTKTKSSTASRSPSAPKSRWAWHSTTRRCRATSPKERVGHAAARAEVYA